MNKLLQNSPIEFLQGLGLSEHEAQVYYASLSIGPAAILKIADAAEVKRTTVYSVVESLQRKGLMNIEIKGPKKLFKAEHPEKLERILESRRHQLQQQLPELTSLYNLEGGESFLKHYEGIQGVKNAYESILASMGPHDFYYVVTDESRWHSLDEKYYEDFRRRRAKKVKEPMKILLQPSEAADRVIKFQQNFNTKAKLLPPEIVLTTNLIVTPYKVLVHQLIPPIFAIVMENGSLIAMHKQMFEIIWNLG